MVLYTAVLTPEAESSLTALDRYIAQATPPEGTQRYQEAKVAYCEGPQSSPHCGRMRDDIRPGLRVDNYKGRCVISFAVTDELVLIICVF